MIETELRINRLSFGFSHMQAELHINKGAVHIKCIRILMLLFVVRVMESQMRSTVGLPLNPFLSNTFNVIILHKNVSTMLTYLI